MGNFKFKPPRDPNDYSIYIAIFLLFVIMSVMLYILYRGSVLSGAFTASTAMQQFYVAYSESNSNVLHTTISVIKIL